MGATTHRLTTAAGRLFGLLISFLRGKLGALRSRTVKLGEQGFTLIELVVTIAIIFALSIGGYIAYTGLVRNAREQQAANPSPSPVEQAPVTPAGPPPDLTTFWIIAGAVGGALLLALVATLFVMALRRAKHSSLQLRKEVEAREEDRRKALAIWQKSVDKHRELSSKVLEVEMDWTMLFSYPVLVDSSVPSTREFHRALKAAGAVSADAPSDINLSMDITDLPYPKLVTAAEEAWEAAWSFAKHTGTKLIPRGERKKIDQILKLLKLAQSSGGSEHERSVAYGRAEKLIQELQFVKVPESAMQAIGTERRLMIEGSGTSVAASVVEPVAIAVPIAVATSEERV